MDLALRVRRRSSLALRVVVGMETRVRRIVGHCQTSGVIGHRGDFQMTCGRKGRRGTQRARCIVPLLPACPSGLGVN